MVGVDFYRERRNVGRYRRAGMGKQERYIKSLAGEKYKLSFCGNESYTIIVGLLDTVIWGGARCKEVNNLVDTWKVSKCGAGEGWRGSVGPTT